MHAKQRQNKTRRQTIRIGITLALQMIFVAAAVAEAPVSPDQPHPTPRPANAEAAPTTPADEAVQADDAAEAGDAERAEPVIDDEALLKRFRVLPQSFQLNSYLHFDDNGNVRNEQHNMSMNLNFFYDPAFAPHSYRNLQIDKLVTDAGEALNVQHHAAGEHIIHHHHHHGNNAPRFNLNFQVTRPTQPANRVRRLSGSVEVTIPMGESRRALLGPVREILGKRVHIANFPGSELQVSRDEHQRMLIRMNKELAVLMSKVQFYGSNNQEIPVQNRGSGRSNNQHTYYYQFDLPDDGKIVLSFFAETRTLRIPFELKDIPLPQPGGGGGIDLVIRAEPGDPIAHRDNPIEDDLDVHVE